MNNEPGQEKELFKALIPKDCKRGIEIGVLFGDTSLFFLQNFPELHLVGIDPFIPDSMERSLIGSLDDVIRKTSPYGSCVVKINEMDGYNVWEMGGRYALIHGYSYEWSASFVDDGYDFVFIDGSHLYDDVKIDYELYCPKIKSGGLIFFHDARMYRGGAPFHPGPSEFVNEIIESDKRIEVVGEAFSLIAFKKL